MQVCSWCHKRAGRHKFGWWNLCCECFQMAFDNSANITVVPRLKGEEFRKRGPKQRKRGVGVKQ